MTGHLEPELGHATTPSKGYTLLPLSTLACESRLGPAGSPFCTRPAVAVICVGCIHEHVKERRTCRSCLDAPHRWCMDCGDAGHWCPLVVEVVAEVCQGGAS